ncbi:MAG: Cna B-type domain-containing protein [Ruthenibacterium sp.]
MSASQSTSAIPEDVIPPAVSSSGTQENDVPAADDLANGELLQGAELPLSLPPQTRAGAPSQDTISLTLTMDWAGGDIETRPDSVTVRLAASNQPIMQRDAVLCADTQWTYTWRDLPAKDAAGNAITYYTNPVSLPNTQFETQYLDAIESIWIPADQFENGEQYVIADATNYAMGLDSGNAQNIRAARVFQTTARINGVDIQGHFHARIGISMACHAKLLSGGVLFAKCQQCLSLPVQRWLRQSVQSRHGRRWHGKCANTFHIYRPKNAREPCQHVGDAQRRTLYVHHRRSTGNAAHAVPTGAHRQTPQYYGLVHAAARGKRRKSGLS